MVEYIWCDSADDVDSEHARIGGNVGHGPRTRLTWDCFTLRSHKRFRLYFAILCVALHHDLLFETHHRTCQRGRKDSKRHPSHQRLSIHACFTERSCRKGSMGNIRRCCVVFPFSPDMTQGCDPRPHITTEQVSGLAYHVSCLQSCALQQQTLARMTPVALYPVDCTLVLCDCRTGFIRPVPVDRSPWPRPDCQSCGAYLSLFGGFARGRQRRKES